MTVTRATDPGMTSDPPPPGVGQLDISFFPGSTAFEYEFRR